MNVRDEIVERRRERINSDGPELGASVPISRKGPIVPFLREPGLICEIKRRSPSRGAIRSDLNPVTLAGEYQQSGVRSVSVLTEEAYFGGSLDDLMAIKDAHSELSLLRKDFLLTEEDIHVSHRAGADAVLLIASILTTDELQRMHALATELGLAALVELHDEDDFVKGRSVRPPLVGINARDLTTFRVDLLTPIRLRKRVDWPNRTVFESGAFDQEDALLVSTSGFSGLLVGEAAVRNPRSIPRLLAGLRGEVPSSGAGGSDLESSTHHRRGVKLPFWSSVAQRLERTPLVKICGITNLNDARRAVELGADLLGFVFAESPRRATADVVRACSDLDVLKVAVVVARTSEAGSEPGGVTIPADVRALLHEGMLDAVQLHGDEQPEECASLAFPYYKAVRPGSPESVGEMERFRCPRVLMDARSAEAYGGTGQRVTDAILGAAVDHDRPLWVAGGVNDTNVFEITTSWRPELVDASSGLEERPGVKDHAKLERFFGEIERARKSG